MKIVSSNANALQGGEHGRHQLSDWVEPYLRDRLTNKQRDQFEQALVCDIQLQDLTRQAYALRQLSQEFPEQLASTSARQRSPMLHYAMAASLGAALVSLPAWWVQQELRQDRGALTAQLAQVQQVVADLARPQAGLAVVQLGVTRSSDNQVALIRQTHGMRWVQLQLPLNSPTGGSWPINAELELATVGGEKRWRYRLEDLQVNGDFALLFPLASAQPGLYDIAIVDQEQTLAEYAFELAQADQ